MIKEGHAMENFFDDDFDEDEFMEEPEDNFEEDLEIDDEPIEDESQNNGFSTKDSFIISGAAGFGYYEGLRERKLRKRKKFSL
jgi:hypothetical protein